MADKGKQRGPRRRVLFPLRVTQRHARLGDAPKAYTPARNVDPTPARAVADPRRELAPARPGPWPRPRSGPRSSALAGGSRLAAAAMAAHVREALPLSFVPGAAFSARRRRRGGGGRRRGGSGLEALEEVAGCAEEAVLALARRRQHRDLRQVRLDPVHHGPRRRERRRRHVAGGEGGGGPGRDEGGGGGGGGGAAELYAETDAVLGGGLEAADEELAGGVGQALAQDLVARVGGLGGRHLKDPHEAAGAALHALRLRPADVEARGGALGQRQPRRLRERRQLAMMLRRQLQRQYRQGSRCNADRGRAGCWDRRTYKEIIFKVGRLSV